MSFFVNIIINFHFTAKEDLTLSLTSPDVKDVENGKLVSLYCYWQPNVMDHLYTTKPTEIGTVVPGTVGEHGFLCVGVTCLIYNEKVKDSVALYRCWSEWAQDHLYTVDVNEADKRGYKNEGEVGYCLRAPCSKHGYASVPLYRFWNRAKQDHYYTIHQMETREQGGDDVYVNEGMICYVLVKS